MFLFPWLVFRKTMSDSLQLLKNLRILHVTSPVSRGSWLEKVLLEVPELGIRFQEAQGSFEGMKALQTQAFDFILVSIRPVKQSLDFIDGCRTGGITAPMMTLGRKRDSNLLTQCCERGGNGVITLEGTTVSDLLWKILLAVREHRSAEQNAELRNRLQQEILRKSKENDAFIERQRKELAEYPAPNPERLTPRLEAQYLELLKNCIPTTENDATQTASFIKELLEKKVTAAELFAMHLNALEIIFQSPGRKSPHHLMNRANLLLNRLTLALLNRYQQQAEASTSSGASLSFNFNDIAADDELL